MEFIAKFFRFHEFILLPISTDYITSLEHIILLPGTESIQSNV
jgi:hypothetical protein